MKTTNFKLSIYVTISLLFILFSCEKEEVSTMIAPSIQQNTIAKPIQDTTYTDAELLKVLEEELDFLKSKKKLVL